jgi:hypothetical protein
LAVAVSAVPRWWYKTSVLDEVNILGLLVITPHLTKEHPHGESIKENSITRVQPCNYEEEIRQKCHTLSRSAHDRYDFDALLCSDEIEGGRFILTRLLIWWSPHLLAVCCFGAEPWSEL